MLPTAALEYELPDDLIATTPAEPRDASRLLVVHRNEPDRLEQRSFRDLPSYLHPGDLLVTNDSSVLAARLAGHRRDTGGKIGGIFINEPAPGVWRVMLQAGGRLTPGVSIELQPPRGGPSGAILQLESRDAECWLARLLDVHGAPSTASAGAIIAALGAAPLPPYILAARKHAGLEIGAEQDRDWYQTVYADASKSGSIAAPTAGLHFTQDLLHRLASTGVRRASVTLHVGIGTFRPVQTDHLEEHPMHAEWCHVPHATLTALETALADQRRVIAVGTTAARTIESLPEGVNPGDHRAGFTCETRLMIVPGYRWNRANGLITNFHLPRSTLMALVASLLPGGVPRLLDLYRFAVRERYRFYSYGDAMLIL